MGAERFVLFGSCGVLDDEKVKKRIIVPVSAVRDEGTSYHYAAPSEEIETDSEQVKVLKMFWKDAAIHMLKEKPGLQTESTEKPFRKSKSEEKQAAWR